MPSHDAWQKHPPNLNITKRNFRVKIILAHLQTTIIKDWGSFIDINITPIKKTQKLNVDSEKKKYKRKKKKKKQKSFAAQLKKTPATQ